MAKYGRSASKRVKSAMHRKKKGTLKSGSGRKVTSRKQAIAIGLSEARKKGAKVPVDLIRFGGHLLKGRYDVHNGRCKEPAVSPAIHG